MSVARDMAAARPRPPSAARPNRCSSPRPASSACRSTSRRSAAGVATAARVARPSRRRRRDARDHDDRSVPEVARRGDRRRRAATITVGGMAKGSGMIEPRMATMLGFLTTDARVEPRRAAPARCAASSTRRSTRSRSMASARPTTACSRWRPGDPASRSRATTTRALLEPLRAVAGHLAREIVRGGEGATKLVTVQRHRRGVARRRVAGGADDRQLAARQDGDSRRRSRTGAGWSPRPADRARRSTSTARRWRSATSRCSSGACRTTSAPTPRPTVLRGKELIGPSTSARAADTRPRCGPATSAPNTCASTRSTGREQRARRASVAASRHAPRTSCRSST